MSTTKKKPAKQVWEYSHGFAYGLAYGEYQTQEAATWGRDYKARVWGARDEVILRRKVAGPWLLVQEDIE